MSEPKTCFGFLAINLPEERFALIATGGENGHLPVFSPGI